MATISLIHTESNMYLVKGRNKSMYLVKNIDNRGQISIMNIYFPRNFIGKRVKLWVEIEENRYF